MTADRVGAYGMALTGLPSNRWLGTAPAEWPVWQLDYSADRAPVPVDGAVPDDFTIIRVDDEVAVLVDGEARRCCVHGGQRPRDSGWVHPVLSLPATFFADWSGRVAFHSGSFLDHSGRVWGLLGDRNGGKSTTLAWLFHNGFQIFADDLLITDGTDCLAGPRCLDLRESAAAHFGIGEALGVVGSRERWRVELPPTPPTAPLGGFVELSWGGGGREPSVRRLEGGARGDALSRARALLEPKSHPFAWLDLLARPVFALTRDKHWAQQDQALATMITAVDAS